MQEFESFKLQKLLRLSRIGNLLLPNVESSHIHEKILNWGRKTRHVEKASMSTLQGKQNADKTELQCGKKQSELTN